MQLLIAKHNAQTSLMPNQLVDVAVVAQHVLTKALCRGCKSSSPAAVLVSLWCHALCVVDTFCLTATALYPHATVKPSRWLQAYAKPPALVELTLSGVMTVLQKTPTWDEAKKQLGDASFMEKLLKFDKDKLNDALLKKLQKFTTNPEFTPEVSHAC